MVKDSLIRYWRGCEFIFLALMSQKIQTRELSFDSLYPYRANASKVSNLHDQRTHYLSSLSLEISACYLFSKMGLPRTMENLTARASLLRDSLLKSKVNTESMVDILGSFDHRLSALEAAMRPTQVCFPLPLIRFDGRTGLDFFFFEFLKFTCS